MAAAHLWKFRTDLFHRLEQLLHLGVTLAPELLLYVQAADLVFDPAPQGHCQDGSQEPQHHDPPWQALVFEHQVEQHSAVADRKHGLRALDVDFEVNDLAYQSQSPIDKFILSGLATRAACDE